MYKVFIYNKPIIFLSHSEIFANKISEKTYQCENEVDKQSVLSILSTLDANTVLYVSNKSLDKLMQLFFGNFKNIDAAGGIVVNPKQEILFIKRLGYWDLPKGKVEKGETLKVAAVREIEEECGIVQPIVQSKLIETLHTYTQKGRNYFKTTHWYLMTHEGTENLVPQTEEGITDARWVHYKNIETQKSNTYNSILDVLEVGISQIIKIQNQ